MLAETPYDLAVEMQKLADIWARIANDPVLLKRALAEFPDELGNVVNAIEKLDSLLDQNGS